MRSSLFCLFFLAACGAPTGSGSLEAPIADPGDDRVIAVGESTTISGLRSCDPSSTGGGVNYLWELLEKPDASVLDLDATQLGSVQFAMTADVAGTYLFKLVVTNGARSSMPEILAVEATTDQQRLTATSSTPETEDRCGNAL